MGSEISKIVNGIYVGTFQNANSEEILESKNITHILSAHNFSEDANKRHKLERILKRIDLKDIETESISPYFSESNDFIHEARLNGGNVLIHCLAGVSRSVTLTCAYLMSVTTLGFNDVLTAIQGARQVANPNRGFRRQLVEFEATKLDAERQRLKDKFGGESPFLESDMETMKNLINERICYTDIQSKSKRLNWEIYPQCDNRNPSTSDTNKIENKNIE